MELTKENIFYNAITYIKKLQDEGKSLKQMLQAMDAKEKLGETETPNIDEFYMLL